MTSNSVSVKELFLATGLPQSSSMESLNLLQKWFADRGNKILPVVDNEKSESIADNILIPTSQFEEPDQTPGLIIHVPVQKSLENLVDAARKSVRLPLKDLSRLLYSLARHLQKNQGVLSLVLSADTKRSFLECKKHDIPLAIQAVYHFAGLPTSQIIGNRFEQVSPEPTVSCLVPSFLSPLLDVVNHLCAAILSHHAVVLLSYPKTSRTISFIVEILLECGFPPGLVNFAPIQELPDCVSNMGFLQICCPEFFGDDFGKIKDILHKKMASETPKKLFWSKKSRSTVIITDTADLESAIASVLDAAVFSGGRANTCPSKILIQETIIEKSVAIFKAKMANFRCGSHLDKSVDYSSIVDAVEAERNAQLRAAAIKEGAEIFMNARDIPSKKGATVLSPLLLATVVAPTSPLFSDDYTGPVIEVIPFRTIKEAVALANNGNFRFACSVWSENSTSAMEISRNLKTSTVWVNAHHLYDAAVGAAGSAGSGWPVFGKNAIFEFLSVSPSSIMSFNESETKNATSQHQHHTKPLVDRTYKMFYGGAQKRPENGASISIFSKSGNGSDVMTVHIPDGGQKDLKNAIDSATVGALTWSKTTPFNRSQILFYIAENLSSRMVEFSSILEPFHKSKLDAENEVNQAIECFFFWAGQCDKSNGEVLIPNSSTSVLHLHEALGVIGAVLPEKCPLLSFAALCGSALAFGNSVVAVPNLENSLVVLEFSAILETSDVPAGVVNVVTGRQEILLPVFGQHGGVAAVWCFSENSSAVSALWKELQISAVSSQQRLWRLEASLDWQNFSEKFYDFFRNFATQNKRIWLPSTESFAN